MNKEMILGISGIGATVLVFVLAVNLMMFREPELKAVQQSAANTIDTENTVVNQVAVTEKNSVPWAIRNADFKIAL